MRIMERIYILTSSSNTLHIDGFCSYASPTGNETFQTEQEAILAKGRHIRMCETCEREKEKVLQEEMKRRKGKWMKKY